jgi:hypothetical protein
LIEWPEGEAEPTKHWLATLPENVSFERLVDLAKLRWRIERDYQELKQEVGLGHYEGRGWRNFHHHARLSTQSLCPRGLNAMSRIRSQPCARGLSTISPKPCRDVVAAGPLPPHAREEAHDVRLTSITVALYEDF